MKVSKKSVVHNMYAIHNYVVIVTATLDPDTLNYEVLNMTSVRISWQHPTNTLQDELTYTVTALVVSSGVTIKRLSIYRLVPSQGNRCLLQSSTSKNTCANG